jgi:hypothetical protein
MSLSRWLCQCQIWQGGHFVPGLALQQTPGAFLLDAAPLLKEEWNFSPIALIANINHPLFSHWSRTWPGLAADDDLVDALQIEPGQWP